MRRGLPKLIRSFRLTATLGLSASRSYKQVLKPGPPGFFGTHDGGAGPFRGDATRGTILRGHLTTGASRCGPDIAGFALREVPFPPERSRYRY